MTISADKTQSVYPQLTSKIDKVKVYAAGATITRVANIQLDTTEVWEHVEIAGLPLALDDSSVRVRVEADAGTAAIATDVRIGLAVPLPQDTAKPPAEEEVREAQAEVKRIEDAIALINNEISILRELQVPKRPDGEEGKAPPPSPIGARLALANFSDEQIRTRIQEKRENLEKLRQAQEHLQDLQQKFQTASTARQAKGHELRKTVIVRLSYEGEVSTITGQRLIVEYFVPGARWTPSYVCRLDSAGNQAAIAVRAFLCQRTGEDWSGVRLELSTAEPLAWCELPELPSLRLGRAQSEVRKSGWRRPPIGAEILFEDFDRQKDVSLAAVSQDAIISEISSPQVSSLPKLVIATQKQFAETFEVNKEELESWKQSLTDQLKKIRFDLLTPKAINAILLAQEEARRLGYNIDTEQILLGLIREDTGLAASILKSIGVDLKYARIEVEKVVGRGSGFSLWDSPDQAEKTAFAEARLASPAPKIPQQRRQAKRSTADAYDITLISPEMLEEEEGESYEPTSFYLLDEIQSLPAPEMPARAITIQATKTQQKDSTSDRLTYNLMRMGDADNPHKRGKLSIEQKSEVYLEILKRRKVVVSFNVMEVVQQAVVNSQNCIYVNLPPGGINVRQVAGSFDYAYSADGRVDVPSDGEFHSVALMSNSTDVDVRYVVVPREDTNVFRIAQLKNPLQAPLLAGPADVYVDGEYILSTNIATVPPKGQMELGLGVEQAIKVARNTTYQEARSGETLVAFNELRHRIQIDIANRLPREARIEVRERLPIPDEDAKVEVQIEQVSPNWEKYEQLEREMPIKGGYCWKVQVPGKEQQILSVDYLIKTFVDSELIDGNRRE